MKCWMVFGEIYGNVDYGMSHCTYLFAVCSTKEEAEENRNHVSNSDSPVLMPDGTMIFNYNRDGIFEEMPDSKEAKDKALKYKHFHVYIEEFNGAPLCIANDYYAE